MRIITKIESKSLSEQPKKRVAAYARVSAETERLMHSLSAVGIGAIPTLISAVAAFSCKTMTAFCTVGAFPYRTYLIGDIAHNGTAHSLLQIGFVIDLGIYYLWIA